jgi:tetratricopeptide (TPR) repeat protein
MRSSLFLSRWSAIGGLLIAPLLFAAEQKEDPVGLILSPGGGKLLRANTETPLDARAGDLLFTGDGLRTAAGPASFLFCPGKTLDTLSASGEVRFEATAPKVKTGKISEAPARACALPQTLRVAVASQQHYGVAMTRAPVDQFPPPIPHDKLPSDVLGQLTPIDAALSADPKDPGALAASATLYENAKLSSNALQQYHKLGEVWPDAAWIKSKIFDLEEVLGQQVNAAAANALKGGQTYALLVGLSKYKDPGLALQFADKDAVDFSKLIETPRVGGIPAQNILLLTDDKATVGAVRNGFDDFLKNRAKKGDTVIILLAGHGTVEIPGSKGAFILTYDSDPQDLKSTSLPMADLRVLFEEQLQKVGRVLLFVDVCKAGTIGTIHSTTISADVQRLEEVEGSLFGLLASRPKEVSREGPEFGGGHGVFSYFVMKGLTGAADANKDGVVDINELIKYVQDQVAQATGDKQHPREFGSFDNTSLADLKKPGMDMAHVHFPVILDSRSGEPLYLASASPEPQAFSQEVAQDIARFTDAVSNRRLLPDQPDNAFNALQKLKNELNPDRYFERENQLRVALEDQGQSILLKYLAGDQNPQTRGDFDSGNQYMDAARKLTPDSLLLEGRQDFFQGRTLLFDKKFPEAANLLEQAIRFDPGAAYGYNALGIAYLEQAQFDRAIPAFRDAAKRAQHWAYPLHNLALSYVETGDYRSAIRAYQDAIKLTPQYSYLPYNLGLVYQRLNRRKEAEASYRKAMLLSPNAAQPYNALGTLKAAEGKRKDAEDLYRQALVKDATLLPARHNLAILLASEKEREQEAIDLWRANLRQSPDYIASRLSLAQALADSGDNAGAIEQYRAVLNSKPGYVAAHTALARLLAKTGDRDGALAEFREASKQDQQNPEILEQIGDLEAASNRSAEARTAYEASLKQAQDRSTRKRIDNKLKSLK